MEPLAPTGSTGDPSTETVVPNPSPYVAPDTETDPEELLDLATIGAGVTQAISAAYAVDAAVALEAQRRVMADGDSDCPGLIDDYYAVYGYYYWYATCSTNLGASFDGYGYLYDVTNVDAGSYFAHEADYWYGLADLRTADDQRYEMTGTVWDYHYRYDSSAYDYYSWGVLGDFLWTGAEYSDTWLARGVSAQVQGYSYRYDSGAVVVWLDGTVGGLTGSFDAAHLRSVMHVDEAVGSNCEAEPGGSIAVRTTGGEWYEVVFDGPTYWGATSFPPSCDGCGEVFHRGVSLGEACPDLSLLTLSPEAPWR